MAIVSVASVAAACGEDTADPPRSTSSTTVGTTVVATDPPATSTTTTTVASDEAEVRAVIDRYWEAWFAATANPPDPDNPELNALLSGEAHDRIIGGVQRWRDNGQYVRLPEGSVFRHETLSVSFDDQGIALVQECVADDSEVVEVATGAVSEGGLAALTVATTLNRFGDDWHITTRTVERRSPGTSSCEPT